MSNGRVDVTYLHVPHTITFRTMIAFNLEIAFDFRFAFDVWFAF